jgi:hypothetical protein
MVVNLPPVIITQPVIHFRIQLADIPGQQVDDSTHGRLLPVNLRMMPHTAETDTFEHGGRDRLVRKPGMRF